MSKKHKVILSVGLVIGIWLLVIQLGLAWTNPAATPPAGNPPPPVQLQGASPGTVQTGNINISGTGLFGGNVGIGTTVPGARLDVVGEIRATHYPWVATNYVGTYHTIHLPTAGQFWVRVVGGARQSANVWISRTVHENFSWAGELAARVTGTGGGWGSFGGQIVLTVNKSGEAGSAQLLHRVAHAEHIGGATAADGLYVLLEGGGRTYHFRGATEATNVGVDGTFDKGGSWREFAVGPGGVHAVFANNAHILAGGNVGIGTTTPGARLQVQGVGTTTAATVNITDSTGASRFFVRDDGNVGIGTTAPVQRLHIMGGRAMIENTAHSLGADAQHLELFAPMGAVAGETSLRFHQGGRWWHQIRARSDGFRFTTGNTDALTHIAAGNVTATAYFHHSDRALKSNIQPIANGLQRVLGLEPVAFNWKDSGETSLGFIAQDVERKFPELVATDAQGSKSVNYSGLIAPLVRAIQEQQKQIDELRAEVEKLR